jgi:hypothetical protein
MCDFMFVYFLLEHFAPSTCRDEVFFFAACCAMCNGILCQIGQWNWELHGESMCFCDQERKSCFGFIVYLYVKTKAPPDSWLI